MTDRENPFLIPPPPKSEGAAEVAEYADPDPEAAAEPTPAAAAEPSPAAAAEPSPAASEVSGPAASAEPMITLPPGLVDSATLRGVQRTARRTVTSASSSTPVRRTADEIVFFPGAPGVTAVAGTPAAEPAVDATVVRAPRQAATWLLVLPDGRTVSVPRRLLLGRNPGAIEGWSDAELLPLADPVKSVSKTHAGLEIDGDDLWVHDLDSTNGVWISGAGTDERQVFPGARARVPADADLELGEIVIRVQRPTA